MVLYCHICDDLLTTSSLFSIPMTSASELMNVTADSDAVEESSKPVNPSETSNLLAAPASPISPAEPLTIIQNTIIEAIHNNPTPVANDPEVGQSVPSVIGGSNTNDVVMEDATSSSSPPKLETQNDEDLPGWLAQMIVYLCGVSEEAARQNLVTRFVNFKKCGPPAGVSSFFLHHHETD